MGVKVNLKGAQRIKAGHPWIFRSDITGTGDVLAGEIVPVLSPKDQFLGQAFYSPRSQITLRLITRSRETIDRSFWRKRIEESVRRREPFRKNREALRLVYGESDLIPSLIVDLYGKTAVFQTLSAGADRCKEDFLILLEELLEPEAIIERNDPQVRELEGLVRQKGVVRGGYDELSVGLGPHRFLVDPLEGQKTGLFLDQIENHERSAAYARGRVLDLFTYQGGFSIFAAPNSEEVIAVDSSAPALEVLGRNADRNQIGNIHRVERNGFDFLREAESAGERFDVVILDPPPFARDRKNMGGATRGNKELNLRAMKILQKDGILITCSCSQNFTPALFEDMLKEAARDTHREIQVLEKRGAAADHPVLLTFPESSYLQCWILRVL